MTFNTTRINKTGSQDVEILKMFQDCVKNVNQIPHQWWDSQPEVDTDGIYVENHYNLNKKAFECNLMFVIWISEGSGLVTGGPSDFQIMSPGGENFAQFPRFC